MPRTLTLYGHRDCRLCTEMRVALAPWRERFGFDLEVVDIRHDEALEARYGQRVPVLAEGEREICHYFLDEDALLRRLRDSRDPPPE